MEWYASLTPQGQAAVQGIVVMVLLAILRACCHWAGHPISESKLAKLGNYLAVAVATAAATLLTTGTTAAFWAAWLTSLWTAVGAWEGISKLYAALTDKDDADATTEESA